MARTADVAKLRAQLARLILSESDFAEALSYLYAKPAEDAVVIRRALLSAAIVAYARPFTQNQAKPTSLANSTVGLKVQRILSAEQLVLHERLLDMRNRAIAHAEHELRPVYYAPFHDQAYLAGHQVFDVLSQPLDRPLFASNCETLLTAVCTLTSELNTKIQQSENAA